jgi:hypothetical protein
VYADLTPAEKTKLGIHSLADMQEHARQCRSLHLCRQAATASKHWEVKNHPDPNVSAIVTVKPITASEDPHSPIYWSFYFVDDKNVKLAEQVFEEALEFWTQFIYQNGIAK